MLDVPADISYTIGPDDVAVDVDSSPPSNDPLVDDVESVAVGEAVGEAVAVTTDAGAINCSDAEDCRANDAEPDPDEEAVDDPLGDGDGAAEVVGDGLGEPVAGCPPAASTPNTNEPPARSLAPDTAEPCEQPG